MSCQHHVAKVAISNCHVAKTMPLQRFGGARDLFQTIFFLQGRFSIFFSQGRKSKLIWDENHIYYIL